MTATRPAHPDPHVVTVWSDIGCPWATLALHTLHAAARARNTTVVIDHRAVPLELLDGHPAAKPRRDAETAVIGGHRPELGWSPWPGPDWAYPVTMLPALEAVQAAKNPAIGGLVGSDELDTALRRAFYAEGRCISLHTVVLDVAKDCPRIDAAALADALATGAGRMEVFRQWEVARGPDIQGSPHLFTAAGFTAHNPGVERHDDGRPGSGFPHLAGYHTAWADELLDALPARPADR